MILLWNVLIVIPLLLRWTTAFTISTTIVSLSTKRENESESRLPSTRLHGVLSRSVIVNKAKNGNGATKNNGKSTVSSSMRGRNLPKARLPPISKPFLLEAMDEARLRQESILQALDKEREKYSNQLAVKNREVSSEEHSKALLTEDHEKIDATDDRSPDRKLLSIDRRRTEILEKMHQIKIMKHQLSQQGRKDMTMGTLKSYKTDFEVLGFKSILEHSPDTWKIRLQKEEDYGRPDGFDGLIFYSPRGVPILVGRPKAHKDETLRRIAQGADLWFQVEDYQGSRVLLRTSLQRGLKDSRECKQMAANLAARYSDWYYYDQHGTTHGNTDMDVFDKERIPIMYCDSRKVAKRGSGVGKMNHRKKLGRMYGDISAVEQLTSEKDLF